MTPHHHLVIHYNILLTATKFIFQKRYQCRITPLKTSSVASKSHQNRYQDIHGLATKLEHAPGSPNHCSGPAPLEFPTQSPPRKARHTRSVLRKLPRHSGASE